MRFFVRLLKWLSPGMKIKRWLFIFWLGLCFFSLGFVLLANIRTPINIELGIVEFIQRHFRVTISSTIVDIFFFLLGIYLMIYGIRNWFKSIYNVIVPNEEKKLVEVVYEKRQLDTGYKIVAIGGGTGLSTLLRGIKSYTNNIVAAVTVTDDGGSSGRLRYELDILPPGDIRNCLVALAGDESTLSSLFQYRFTKVSGLEGHSFGNLFLAAMSDIAGDFEKAVNLSSKILAIRGRVLPVTLQKSTLCAELEDGTIVMGETNITKHGGKIRRLFLNPEGNKPLPEVIQAIREADAIILGPGSLYTSVLPNLLVDGMVNSIKESKAMKIYVCNVMTQPGETDNFSASDHLRAIIDQTGEKLVDYIVINNEMPTRLVEKYKAQGAHPVLPDMEEIKKLGVEVLAHPLINETDLVRHDPKSLSEVLIKSITERKVQSYLRYRPSQSWKKLLGLLEG